MPDNNQDELREKLLTINGICSGPYDIPHRCSNMHCEHCGICDYSDEIIALIQAEAAAELSEKN